MLREQNTTGASFHYHKAFLLAHCLKSLKKVTLLCAKVYCQAKSAVIFIYTVLSRRLLAF